MRIALFQPEIPGNVGAILRLAACLEVAVDIIEPCGFAWSDARVRRAGMDYIDHVAITRHERWDAFAEAHAASRILLMTTHGAESLYATRFARDDVLLFGRESAGVPDTVRNHCAGAVRIPLSRHVRSLNVAVAAGIATAEALRQTGSLPA